MEVSQQKNGENKRKRLDARAFKEWHISQAKNNKKQNGDDKLQKCNENHEASCSKEKGSECETQKNDCDVQPQPGNDEEICGVPVDCELTSSAKASLSCEITHDEVIDHGALGSKQRSEDLPGCKTKVPRWIEYWVPVGLSYVQLEKYCETLIKNSMFLCSRVRNEVLDDVHEILMTVKKCCDHPYLVDPSVYKFLNNGRPQSDHLRKDIEASGKLLLLDKLLQEVKEKQLRVLVVFQSNELNTQAINLQYILDDLIFNGIGEEHYVHIYREFDSAKKQAMVNLFNDKEKGKLVMLLEKSSCQQNIKLSSLDCVIFFNSDWSPINDLKSLRKMSIESKFDHLKVFRLYSSKSVEEKALDLAKKGAVLESSLNNCSYNRSHMLLLWGTTCLFSKLDELHSRCSKIEDINCLCEDNMVSDVLNELSALLSGHDSNNVTCSLISKVEEADYSRNITLHGEQDEPVRDDDIPPSTIWNSLLEGRNPLWILLPRSSEKIRRRGEPLARTAQCAECDNVDAKVKKTSTSANGFLSPKSRAGKVSKQVSGNPKSHRDSDGKFSARDHCSNPNQIDKLFMRKMKELILRQKKEIREFYRTKFEGTTKLEKERKLKEDLLNKRYGETPIKQEELKNLELIYKRKLEVHNHQMDIKKKNMFDQHLSSRKMVKQLKEKLFTLLKTENVKTSITSPGKLSLDNPLPHQSVGLVEKSPDSTIMLSNNSISESNHSHEIEHARIDASVQQGDLEFPLDHVHVQTEGEIFSEGCDEENDAISLPREEVSDTAESGTTATLVRQQRTEEVEKRKSNLKDPASTSNVETEIRGAADSGATTTVARQQRLHDGDYDMEACNGESNGMAELRDASDSGVIDSVAVDKRIEEVQDGQEANVEAHLSCALDSGTTATVESHERIEKSQDGNINTDGLIGKSNCEAEMSVAPNLGTTDSVASQKMIEELHNGDCNTDVLIGESNGETELRGALDLDTSVAKQQMIEEPEVPPSTGEAEMGVAAGTRPTGVVQQSTVVAQSRLNDGSQVVESQALCSTRNSSSIEQAMVSSNVPCSEIRETAGTSTVSNCQTIRVHAPCQQGQAQVLLGNVGFTDQPVVQSQLQSSTAWDQPHRNSGTALINQSDNICFQESSSLRTNLLPSVSLDPLQNELLRMEKEKEEAAKILEDKTAQLNSACERKIQEIQQIREREIQEIQKKHEREIQEIQKNRDVFLREFNNAHLQKYLELESNYRKVYANKLLADTLQSSNQKLRSCPMSQDELQSAILKFSQPNLPVQISVVGNVTPTPTPVQVNQLSELVTFGPTRPHASSALHNIGNSLAGYHVRSPGPHIRPQHSPVTSLSTTNMMTSFYGLMNQQAAFGPHVPVSSWHQQDALRESSFQLGAMPQYPYEL